MSDRAKVYAEIKQAAEDNPGMVLVLQMPNVPLICGLTLTALIEFQMQLRPDAEAEEGGWFDCCSDTIKTLNTGRLFKHSFMRKLINAGYVKTDRDGQSQRQLRLFKRVWIDYEKIERDYTAERARLHALMEEDWLQQEADRSKGC